VNRFWRSILDFVRDLLDALGRREGGSVEAAAQLLDHIATDHDLHAELTAGVDLAAALKKHIPEAARAEDALRLAKSVEGIAHFFKGDDSHAPFI
jgi:hypothetical protein